MILAKALREKTAICHAREHRSWGKQAEITKKQREILDALHMCA
jgi:hypothetical protein